MTSKTYDRTNLTHVSVFFYNIMQSKSMKHHRNLIILLLTVQRIKNTK